MARSSLFLLLSIVPTALAQNSNPKGNSECAQWCAANFQTPGANCTSLAAQGKGPCYVCGPGGTDPHEKLCGGACSDTSLDSKNCGACGNVCITDSTCKSSACVCTNSGKPPCNGKCPDLTSDNKNCGACGKECAVGTTCRSGACAPPPVTCSTYTASCSQVMNGILASNSIASPELVDYRIQSAILGLTTPGDFLAALGPDPCRIYTDATEHGSCVALLANSQFVGQLTDVTKHVLGALETCASTFAAGGQDYQITIREPANCVAREKRAFSVEENFNYGLNRSIWEAIQSSANPEGAPLHGSPKSSALQLVRKQASTCRGTGQCFQTCPSCRLQQTVCGTQSLIITTAVCGLVGVYVKEAVTVGAAGLCGTLCAESGPGALACAAFCAKVAGGWAAVGVGFACAESRTLICGALADRCASCNSANNGICDAGTAQCCPGETGTQCGAGCCCCPRCQAPGGINCECMAAPC